MLRQQSFLVVVGKVDSPELRLGPPRGSDIPPACHSLPLGFESIFHQYPYQEKSTIHRMVFFSWWGKVDSNHRRHCQQIYSLSPLATREFPHIQLPTFRWSWWTDSNPRPADYKSAALPAELHQRLRSARQPAYNSKCSLFCQLIFLLFVKNSQEAVTQRVCHLQSLSGYAMIKRIKRESAELCVCVKRNR